MLLSLQCLLPFFYMIVYGFLEQLLSVLLYSLRTKILVLDLSKLLCFVLPLQRNIRLNALIFLYGGSSSQHDVFCTTLQIFVVLPDLSIFATLFNRCIFEAGLVTSLILIL